MANTNEILQILFKISNYYFVLLVIRKHVSHRLFAPSPAPKVSVIKDTTTLQRLKFLSILNSFLGPNALPKEQHMFILLLIILF